MSPLEEISNWLNEQDEDLRGEIASLLAFLLFDNVSFKPFDLEHCESVLQAWLTESNSPSFTVVGRAVRFRACFEFAFAKRFTSERWEQPERLLRSVVSSAASDPASDAAKIASSAFPMLRALPDRQWRILGISWASLFERRLSDETLENWQEGGQWTKRANSFVLNLRVGGLLKNLVARFSACPNFMISGCFLELLSEEAREIDHLRFEMMEMRPRSWRRRLGRWGSIPLALGPFGGSPPVWDEAQFARLSQWIQPEERLDVRRIDYASPGSADLVGIGAIVGHLKDFMLKMIERQDLKRQRELSEERAELENERARLENAEHGRARKPCQDFRRVR
jgi:hypothetical protein